MASSWYFTTDLNSNYDIYRFGNHTFANLVDPTPSANVRLEYMGIPLALTNNFWTGAEFAPINFFDIRNSYTMPPVPFGLQMFGTLTDPTHYSDGTLRNFDIGLSGYNNKITMDTLMHYGINPANYMFSGLKFNFGTTSGITFTPPTQHTTTVDADRVDNSDKAVFERKVKLIIECGDYKDEIAKIRKEMGNDYKKGIEKLDELMSQIDADKLNEAAKKLYQADRKNIETSAANIANNWAEAIAKKVPGDNFEVNTSSINKNNVLDVIGNYIRHEKFSTGKSEMWNPLITANYDKLSKAIFEKAEDLKKIASDTDKAAIDTAVKNLKDTKEANRPEKFYDLFKKLREIQATANDTKAAERYGVPNSIADTSIKDAKTAYDEEVESWESTPNISADS